VLGYNFYADCTQNCISPGGANKLLFTPWVHNGLVVSMLDHQPRCQRLKSSPEQTFFLETSHAPTGQFSYNVNTDHALNDRHRRQSWGVGELRPPDFGIRGLGTP